MAPEADCARGGLQISELTFEMEGGRIVDSETGSRWDLSIGVVMEGLLEGTPLQQVP